MSTTEIKKAVCMFCNGESGVLVRQARPHGESAVGRGPGAKLEGIAQYAQGI